VNPEGCQQHPNDLPRVELPIGNKSEPRFRKVFGIDQQWIVLAMQLRQPPLRYNDAIGAYSGANSAARILFKVRFHARFAKEAILGWRQ
tara:strand:+ start:175 stop:441 length:267 start_codon:yes stop_codon:yes gene_type:complete